MGDHVNESTCSHNWAKRNAALQLFVVFPEEEFEWNFPLVRLDKLAYCFMW
jgi:hypothetical protein